jgi:hypothetical protein
VLVLLGNTITKGHWENEERSSTIKLKVDIDTRVVVFSPEAPKFLINLCKCDGTVSRKRYVSSGTKCDPRQTLRSASRLLTSEWASEREVSIVISLYCW